MKVTNNKVIKLIPGDTYVHKTCPHCNSSFDVLNEDVVAVMPDASGKINLTCPCCGGSFQLTKYFEGNQYDSEIYSDCIHAFETEIWNALHQLEQISRGFGIYYYNLSQIKIYATPTKIIIVPYIDEYEPGNWHNCIRYDVEYNSKIVFDILSKFSKNNLKEYARYSQALLNHLVDWIQHKPVTGLNTLYVRYLSILDSELKYCFRDGDTKDEITNMNYNAHHKVVSAARKEKHTVYTPDTYNGLTKVSDSVMTGSTMISDAIYAVAFNMPGTPETPSDVHMHGIVTIH